VVADAVEDARLVRKRIDALADAAAELLRDLRRDADRLTTELALEPEVLNGIVLLDRQSDPHGTDDEPRADRESETEPDAGTAEEEDPLDFPATNHSSPDEPTGAVDDHADLEFDAHGPSHDASDEWAAGEHDDRDDEADVAGAAEPADGEPAADAPSSGAEQPEAEHDEDDAVATAVVVESDDAEGSAEDAEGDGSDQARELNSVPCEVCETTGQCTRCGGKGRRLMFRCSACHGSGRCSACGGPGFVWSS
jgi:hypothetical protein